MAKPRTTCLNHHHHGEEPHEVEHHGEERDPALALRRFRARPGQQGIALLLVMMVVMLIVIIVTELSLTARVDLEVSTNELDDFAVEYCVRGAMDAARFLLKQDAGENKNDGLQDKWAKPTEWVDLNFGEDIQVKIDVVDESRKYNLYWLLKGTPTEKHRARDRLVAILDTMREETPHDLSPAEAADIANKITDYVRVRRGGKRKEYEGIILAPTRKHVLMSLEELLPFIGEFIYYDQIDDVGTKLAGLERYVTIWSNGQVNVNTAELIVLQAHFSRGEALKAERIIEAREKLADPEENPELKKAPTLGKKNEDQFIGIKSLDDLVKADAITNKDKQKLGAFLGTKSQVFSIFITAKKRRIMRRHRLVIRREKDKLYTLLSEVRKDQRVVMGEEGDPFEDEEGLSGLDVDSLLGK